MSFFRSSALVFPLFMGFLALAPGCTPLTDYYANGFKVGPQYSRPPAPVADDWIDNSDKRILKDPDEHRKWWTVFNDTNLDNLICSASNQNLKVREAGYRVLASRAELAIAIGRIMPQQQFVQGSFSQNALSIEVANRQFIPQNFYPQFNYGLGIAWELDFWGKYRRTVESAANNLDANIEEFDDFMVLLLADVVEAYTRMRYFERVVDLLKENIEFQKISLTIATARFKGGLASELDVDQGQSDLSFTESQVPLFQRLARLENNRLCLLLGISPEDLEKKIGPGKIPVAPKTVAVGIPAELITRRPDVRKVEREAAAECARIGVATADLYPHISLDGAIGANSMTWNNLFNPKAMYGSIAPGFRWNVLNYGRLINHVRLQDAKFQAAVARYQNTVVTAGKEVEDGLAEFLRAQEQTAEMEKSVTAIRKAGDLVIVQYRAGTTDFNRVSLVQEKRVSRELELAQAQFYIAEGLVKTYKALGGGWQIRLDGCSLAESIKLDPPKKELPKPEGAKESP